MTSTKKWFYQICCCNVLRMCFLNFPQCFWWRNAWDVALETIAMLATHRSLVYWKVMMMVAMMAQHQWYPLFFLCYFLFSLLWKLKLIMMSPLLLWEFLDTSDFVLETFLISILNSKCWVRIGLKTFLARQVLRAFLEWCLVSAQGWPWNLIGANHHVFLAFWVVWHCNAEGFCILVVRCIFYDFFHQYLHFEIFICFLAISSIPVIN